MFRWILSQAPALLAVVFDLVLFVVLWRLLPPSVPFLETVEAFAIFAIGAPVLMILVQGTTTLSLLNQYLTLRLRREEQGQGDDTES